tara:strand:+ start:230 stop:427 length:198 start_codon:yes stop_codon:yes gene_type:complete
MEEVRRLSRYTKNLKLMGDKIYSYDTHVANIQHDGVKVLDDWWNRSQTTRKHIKYVSQIKNLPLI